MDRGRPHEKCARAAECARTIWPTWNLAPSGVGLPLAVHNAVKGRGHVRTREGASEGGPGRRETGRTGAHDDADMSTSSRGTVRPTRGRRRSSQAAGDADDPDTSFTGSDPTMPMSSSPTALGGGGGKGKAREVKGYEVDPVMEAEFRSWAEEGAAERSKAYADRMKQALGSSGSTNQQNGPAGDDEDEDEVFVYTGKDVRGSQLFSPPASFKRRAGGKAADEEGEEREMDYAARLDAVLGPSTSTSSKPAEDEDDAFALPAQLVASSAAEVRSVHLLLLVPND